jgi:hypothetical protein
MTLQYCTRGVLASVRCASAWGPEADRGSKRLIDPKVEGYSLGVYWRGEAPGATLITVSTRAGRGRCPPLSGDPSHLRPGLSRGKVDDQKVEKRRHQDRHLRRPALHCDPLILRKVCAHLWDRHVASGPDPSVA